MIGRSIPLPLRPRPQEGMWPADRSAARAFAPGERLLGQAEPTSRLHVIIDGSVRLSAVSAGGRQAVLDILGPGGVFGEAALVGRSSPLEARALTWGRLLAVDPEALGPAETRALIRALASRLTGTTEALADSLLHDVAGRLLLRLRALGRRHGSPAPGGRRIDLRLTQSDLAHLVGATRESVNRALARLSADRLIWRQGWRYAVALDPSDPAGDRWE